MGQCLETAKIDYPPTLFSYLYATVTARPSLISNFSNAPSFLYSQEFIEATIASGHAADARDNLVRKANNNLLVTSLLLGVSFSMINGDYTPHGWDPAGDDALLFESSVETLALLASMLFIAGLLSNTGLATTAAAVPADNFRLWAKGNISAIAWAELPIMLGIWAVTFAMAATGWSAVPYQPAFWGAIVVLLPLTVIPITYCLNITPLLTSESGVLHQALLPPSEQLLPPRQRRCSTCGRWPPAAPHRPPMVVSRTVTAPLRPWWPWTACVGRQPSSWRAPTLLCCRSWSLLSQPELSSRGT